ncbi:MAG: MATE family efflux transporter [Lachnospiraceae bacterium]|nr:MATE family efflux transporter [Lachnospiraceae bacterium]
MKKQSEAVQYNGITEGVIWQQILIFFFPILFGTFFQQLYNTADAMIVGKFVGKEALSAVGGTTGTLINLLVGFFVGMSSGAAVIVSQYYGAGQEEQVKKSVHTSFCLAILGGVVLMLIGEAFAPYAISAMGAPAEIMDYSVMYMRIYFLGVIGNLVYNMGAAILRAVGDSRRPLYFLIASCLTNIALDLLFVVGLRLEVAGAALATILSQLLSATLVMVTLIRSRDTYRFEFKALRMDRPILRRVIRIGLPTGLQSMMYSISNILIQANINSFGTNTIASWAVFGKMDGLFWMAMDAMGISITTFAGQNFGAGKIDRLKKGTYVGLLMSTIITVGLAALMIAFGPVLNRLFTNDPAVLEESMSIIRFLVPFWLCYVCVNVYPSTLRGIGDAFIPMLIICVGTCVFRVIWVMTASVIRPDLYVTISSYPLSWSITSIAFLIYYYGFSAMRNLNKRAGIKR